LLSQPNFLQERQLELCCSKRRIYLPVSYLSCVAMTPKGRVIIYKRGWYRREARYDYTIFPTHVSTMFVNSIPDHLKGCNLTSNPLRKVGIIVMTSKKKNLTKETFLAKITYSKATFYMFTHLFALSNFLLPNISPPRIFIYPTILSSAPTPV